MKILIVSIIALLINLTAFAAKNIVRTNEWGTVNYSVQTERVVKWIKPDPKGMGGLARMGWRTYLVENPEMQWAFLTNTECVLIRKEIREERLKPMVSYFLLHRGTQLSNLFPPLHPQPPPHVVILTEFRSEQSDGAPMPPRVRHTILRQEQGLVIEPPPAGLHDMKVIALDQEIRLRVVKTDRSGNVVIGLSLPAKAELR